MAKFCTKCGSPLAESQICDCQKQVVKKEENSDINFKEYLNKYRDVMKNIFTKPIDIINKYVTSDNYVFGLLSILVSCIVCGFFMYLFMKEMYQLSINYLSVLSNFGTSTNISFMKLMVQVLLYTGSGYIMTALMIYAFAGAIFKDKIDVKRSVALVGVCSVLLTIVTLLATIGLYVSVKFMIIVILLGIMFYLTYLYQGINEITKLDKNKLAYVFVPAIGIAIFTITYILPSILS